MCTSVSQVLELIARGYATKEAASKLGISYKTADSHRSHVLKKLALHETASVPCKQVGVNLRVGFRHTTGSRTGW